jgi:threonine dehydratase
VTDIQPDQIEHDQIEHGQIDHGQGEGRPSAWPTPALLESAQRLIASTLAPTPLVRLWSSNWSGDTEIYLKLETVQPTGSFKVRGALAATAAYASAGQAIVTASAGNHGLGIAWSAARLGVAATVVVPETASPTKIDALRTFPISLVLHGADFDAAEAHALTLANDQTSYVSAYNDAHVIAGQSSLLTEVLVQIDGPFTIVTPVGGGGLVSGVALAAAAADRDLRVVGVEAAASRAVSTAVQAGRVVPVEIGATIADGLAGNLDPGAVSPQIIRATGTRLEVADEQSLCRALRTLAADAGVYAEGSSAAGLAALLNGDVPTDRPVVIAVTGRNITAASFAEAISRR